MRFTCPNCGARFGSADEPASGRVYSVRCRCGTQLNLAGAAPRAQAAVAAGARYDPYAASHGLLLDAAEARSLAAGQPILEPAIQAANGEEVEVTVTFSTLLALPRGGRAEPEVHDPGQGGGKREARSDRPPKRDGKTKEQDEAPGPGEEHAPVERTVGWVPPFWSPLLAALLAFVLAGGGSAWYLLPQTGVHSPLQLLERFTPVATASAETPPERAPPGEPVAPAASPPEVAAAPEAPTQAESRPADPEPRRVVSKRATQRGKASPARDRKLARRIAADRR